MPTIGRRPGEWEDQSTRQSGPKPQPGAKDLNVDLDSTGHPAEITPPPGYGNRGSDESGPLKPVSKANNPKDGFGVLKAGITSYMSMPVLFEQSVGMMAGGYKYGAHNYLCVAPRSSVYTDAALRHIGAFIGGEDFDPHAGPGVVVHHLTAAMNSLHVIRAAIINGEWEDDRPPPMPKGFIESLEASIKALAANNPEPVARYLANGKRGPGRILK